MDAPTESQQAERALRNRYPARVVRAWSRAQGWLTPPRGDLDAGTYQGFHDFVMGARRLEQERVVRQMQRAHQ